MNYTDKKGQELSTATIILIVLGVLILVILIVGFTLGWNKILPFIKPTNNVDDIVQQCSIACNLDQKYNYCSKEITLKSEQETIESTTCYILFKKKPAYEIAACPAFTDCGFYDDLAAAKKACTAVSQSVGFIGTDLKKGFYLCIQVDVDAAVEAEAEAAEDA